MLRIAGGVSAVQYDQFARLVELHVLSSNDRYYRNSTKECQSNRMYSFRTKTKYHKNLLLITAPHITITVPQRMQQQRHAGGYDNQTATNRKQKTSDSTHTRASAITVKTASQPVASITQTGESTNCSVEPPAV